MHYFNLKFLGVSGRGGVIKLFLACAGIELPVDGIELAHWPVVKGEMLASGANPLGTVPVVTLPDGSILTESHAILRRFARMLGLYGCDLAADYAADVIADSVIPLRDAWAGAVMGDEAAKAALRGSRAAMYAVLEALALKYALAAAGRPLVYSDVLLWAILWDDARLYGSEARAACPTLSAFHAALTASYPPLAAFAADNAAHDADEAAPVKGGGKAAAGGAAAEVTVAADQAE